MKLKTFVLILTVICFVFAGCQPVKKLSKKHAERPNIILIMSDDMGYSDIGCYGGVINTPNLDNLAKKGLRFTQFYNGARCCPTRASLITGLYAQQAGVGHMTEDKGNDGYSGDLSIHAVTIAQVLKKAGYSTYMSGKWHVTPYIPEDDNPSKKNWPLQRGFDKFFGTILGAGSYCDPASLARDNEYIVPSKDFYYTDAITQNAVKYIKEDKGDKPFFMYVAYTAAHWPMQAKPEDIAKYKGKFDDGWDALRQKKYENLVKMGLVKPEWKLSQRDPSVPKWEDEKRKKWNSSLMEVYAAIIDCMDQGIGNIMNTLDEKGIRDNTLVFFLEDNGACAERRGIDHGISPYYKDVKVGDIRPMGKNERQRDMCPKYTRDGKPIMCGIGQKPGKADSYVAYGKAWANASNTPFRLYKHWDHEGGISTPLIVSWPDGIKSKNEFRSQTGHIIDIMATCVDVAGAVYPKSYNGDSIIPMQGVSLVPVFENKELPNRPIFWEHEGNKAVRFGKYKLVSKWKKDSEYNWELYDMDKDRSEMNNLIKEMPEKANEMKELWKNWAKKIGVYTWKPFKPVE